MSRPSIYISIPKPCHEGWDNMDMTERGAFCHSCHKEVIDFSAMTDREVVEYLSKHQTGCGRFRTDQLDTKLTIPQVENGVFRWKVLLLSILPFISIRSFARPSVAAPIEMCTVLDKKDSISKSKHEPVELSEITITGNARKRTETTIGVMTTDAPKIVPLNTKKDSLQTQTYQIERVVTTTGITNITPKLTGTQRVKAWFRRTFNTKRHN
jgi:hypothetical protein